MELETVWSGSDKHISIGACLRLMEPYTVTVAEPGSKVRSVESCDLRPSIGVARSAVLRILQQRPWMNGREIAKAMKKAYKTIVPTLRELVEDEQIEFLEQHDGKQGRPVRVFAVKGKAPDLPMRKRCLVDIQDAILETFKSGMTGQQAWVAAGLTRSQGKRAIRALKSRGFLMCVNMRYSWAKTPEAR